MRVLGPIYLLVVIAGTGALAEPQEWMKVENPNELAYSVFVRDSCPFETNDVEKVVEGVFVRSRVKPLFQRIHDGDLFLNVVVHCADAPTPHYLVDIQFGLRQPVCLTPFLPPGTSIYFRPNYGSFGEHDRQSILDAIKHNAEQAIADFLKANFDL